MSEDIRSAVRDRYAQTARQAPDVGSGCGCGGTSHTDQLGYERSELDSIPATADLGLGCGNPTALAGLQLGETVVDLGSGGGIDCFLASRRVGPGGRVIGVDMTPEMIDRARAAARNGGFQNVEFRLGEIENLPVADGTVDAVISNCVINLSPDKGRVFREAFRALKPGGRLLVSDIVLAGELPAHVRQNAKLWAGCLAGAIPEREYLRRIREAGFSELSVVSRKSAPLDPDQIEALRGQLPEPSKRAAQELGDLVLSLQVRAKKHSHRGERVKGKYGQASR
jgi:SAM-dependent methyltransferase